MIAPDEIRICVLGLGYVGLPLALEFAKHHPVTGFDVNQQRISELQAGVDSTLEADAGELAAATGLTLTSDIQDAAGCTIYIVTVPTPIDAHKRPDLTPLLRASETLGTVLSPGNVVIYESTVYPGATEEDCIPVVERASGLVFNRDFFAGYSPERINPGDKAHRLPDIAKVTAGSTPEAANFIDDLYAEIIRAGTHKASSIRVAEAAKVIENTQRDLNIALINELSILFSRMGLDTLDVLEAAATKWNFQHFRPGLVGGHCIGVDPYYLTHKAQSIGYHPEMILAGRRINDGMGQDISDRILREMIQRDIPVKGARVLMIGLAFKEDCPDLRNTKVVDMIRSLESYGMLVDTHDPMVPPQEAKAMLGRPLVKAPTGASYDVAVVAVAHSQIRAGGLEALLPLLRPNHVIFDLKGILPRAPDILRP